jgi:hypothetical protein
VIPNGARTRGDSEQFLSVIIVERGLSGKERLLYLIFMRAVTVLGSGR